MMRRFIPAIFFIQAILISNLRAQSYSSVHYDTKDGLPSTTVYDITQDKNGFIWFGTENGLCRFDGKNFKTFTTKDGLPDNSILKVHADNSGRVYFTPFTHSLYYYQNDSFYKFTIPDKYKVDLSLIQSFISKGDKTVIGGIHETYIIDGNQVISVFDKYKMNPNTIGIPRVYDSLVIFASRDSLHYVFNSGRKVSYLRTDKGKEGIVYDDSAQQRQLKISGRLDLMPLLYLSQNLAYMFRGDSIFIFNVSTGNMIRKFSVDKVSRVFVDNENNFWVSTLSNGVYRFPSFSFANMKFDGKSEIFSLINFGQQLIAGTDYSKMYQIPVTGSDPGYLTMDFSKFTESSNNPVPIITKRNRVYALYADEKYLYIGTDAFLLRKTVTSPPVFKNIYPVKDIDIVNKKILVCTGYNALLLDEDNESIKDTLLMQRTTCGVIYHGDYYIGTLGGLIKIDAATKKITELYNSFSSFKGRITAIKRGIDDDLWVATSGSGLTHFKNDKIIQTLKEENGLTSDICTSLFIDKDLIWLGTNKGLNRIETGKEKPFVTRITSANGLGADFINTVMATDSVVYVGTAAGLSMFSKNILSEKSVCILHILQVSENNGKLKTDSSYSFSHDALNIRIDFTAISFKSAGDITYYYRLKGLDEHWNTTTANFVNFPILQPGNYTLLLKAINKFNVESETKTIRITIRPPWWQTWFFMITALVITGLLVLIIYRYNIRNIKRKEELKREFEMRFAALEQRALQAQMNPHFIFNALNSIQTFILNLDAEGANNYLTSFASLIRQTLDNSMQPLITIASELKYLETYLSLEKLRFREKFRYEIRVDESIDQNNTVLPGMLLQPYIENSLRHGIQHRKDNNGLISLTINKITDNSVLYTITDNGVGRKKAQELKSSRHIEYQSRGISINEKRVVAINNQFNTNIRVNTQDIIDDDGMVTGTIVSVLIPPLHKQLS